MQCQVQLFSCCFRLLQFQNSAATPDTVTCFYSWVSDRNVIQFPSGYRQKHSGNLGKNTGEYSILQVCSDEKLKMSLLFCLPYFWHPGREVAEMDDGKNKNKQTNIW